MPGENQPVAPPPVKPKSGSNWALIIIIIVVAFIVLGVGGYFGWKYLVSKYIKKSTTTTATTTVSQKMQDLVDLFKYPGSTTKESIITDTSSEMTMETSDSVKVSYAYYEEMIKLNSWTEGSKGYSTDDVGGWLTIEEKDFTALVQVEKVESSGKTLISISITSSNTAVTSGRAKPEVTSTSTTTTTTADTSKTTISTDYIIADSDSRVISESELTNLTPWELKVARNEIYARHGREFVHKDLQCYFQTKSWYSINPNFSESMLSATENKNVATIQAYEQKINSPLQSKDSGC